MKNTVISICLSLLALTCLTACFFCYWRLDQVPHGFHVDELSSAVDIACVSTEGADAHGVAHPLFSDMNYGTPKPLTYIYPGVLWAKVFGASVPSLRAYSVTVFFLGLAALFLIARQILGLRYALLSVALASISPWTWVLGRTAFESMFAMTFMIWGVYFFLKPVRLACTIMAGLFFSAAMYSYPPFRLQIPLLVLLLIGYSYWDHPRSFKSWLIFAGALIIPSIPLIQKILSGQLQQRFNMISIFSKDYLNSVHSSGSVKDLLGIFFNNILLHFNADYLFLTGDPYLIHSTRHFGILSWMDMLGLSFALIFAIMMLFKNGRADNPWGLYKNLICFLALGVLIGVVPSSLTTDLPNSLRSIGAWPFSCLLTSFFLFQACERWWGMWIASSVLTIIFAFSFLRVYFLIYPDESKGFYSFWTLDQAKQMKTDEDWLKFLYIYRHQDYDARYFLMQYHGLSCTESRKAWEGMRDYLTAQGKY